MGTIIITGANRGIGLQCALEMARLARDKQIIITARDIVAGKKAAEQIKQTTGHKNVIAMGMDLGSLNSIKQFRDEFVRAKYPAITTLVNNAGLQNVGNLAYTKDGFEETFGVNHLGPFYLTLLMLPYVPANARITFTASGTHDPKQKTGMPAPAYTDTRMLAHPEKNLEKLMPAGQRRYTTSKLCNVMAVYELQRHLAHTDIHINAFDPGFVPGTGLARNYPPFLKFISDKIFPVLTLFAHNVNTAKTSGINLANLAYAPEYKQYKGKYFEGKKEIPSSEESYNKAFQEDLWQGSLQLTGIKKEDTISAIFAPVPKQ